MNQRELVEDNLQLRPVEETVRALLANVIAGHEAQRRRIARELDDETAQTLTSVLLGLQIVEGAEDLPGVHNAASVLRASVSDVLLGVERIALGLRPPPPPGIMSIRVFIADDHGVLRGGLRVFISAQTDMEVVGEAANGPDAERGILSTEPDVVLMDISMPGGGGLAAMAAVKRVRPKTRFVVLTGHDQPGYVRAAADAGATGYVVKSAVDTELLSAIRRVAEGRTFLDASIDVGPVKVSLGAARAPAGGAPEPSTLNEREREVMGRLAEGYTNSQIAEELQLGVKSIEKHRARIMEKLGLANRSDLVRFALECGILSAGK